MKILHPAEILRQFHAGELKDSVPAVVEPSPSVHVPAPAPVFHVIEPTPSAVIPAVKEPAPLPVKKDLAVPPPAEPAPPEPVPAESARVTPPVLSIDRESLEVAVSAAASPEPVLPATPIPEPTPAAPHPPVPSAPLVETPVVTVPIPTVEPDADNQISQTFQRRVTEEIRQSLQRRTAALELKLRALAVVPPTTMPQGPGTFEKMAEELSAGWRRELETLRRAFEAELQEKDSVIRRLEEAAVPTPAPAMPLPTVDDTITTVSEPPTPPPPLEREGRIPDEVAQPLVADNPAVVPETVTATGDHVETAQEGSQTLDLASPTSFLPIEQPPVRRKFAILQKLWNYLNEPAF